MKLFSVAALSLLLFTSLSPVQGSDTKSTTAAAAASMESHERLAMYKERGYEWPLPNFVPNTPGWNKLMNERLEQVSAIDDPVERFKGYTTSLYQAIVILNYTEYGFARTRISDNLLKELQQGIIDGYDANRRPEGYTPTLSHQAWHIERDDLTAMVDDELHAKLEEWGNVDLDTQYVYGLRLFRNETTLKMHIDKKGSHAMGFVLHVASSDDYNDPWPFVIEDFHGRTHEILMDPGDVIFFESAKLMHGRPRKLNASWYCNVAGHYHPRDKKWNSMNHVKEAEYAVPPKWVHDVVTTDENNIDTLEFRGGLHEPNCDDGWCRLASPDTVKWNGSVDVTNEEWINGDGTTHRFVGRRNKMDDYEL